MNQKQIDKLNAHVDKCIKEYGFFIFATTGTFGSEEFEYSYTVGQTEHNLPEIIMVGDRAVTPDARTIHKMISESLEFLKTNHSAEEYSFESKIFILKNTRDNEEPKTSKFKLIKLTDETIVNVVSNHMLAVKVRYNRNDVFKSGVYQLVVSDANNLFAGEDGYDGNFKQPILNNVSFDTKE